MAKAGMRRPGVEEPHGHEAKGYKQKFPKNEVEPVPEIQGKAKETKKKQNRLINFYNFRMTVQKKGGFFLPKIVRGNR